jgi:hypothetical protein
MASLRPPSISPSPSPEPGRNANARQSMGPSARGSALAPGSPRLGGTPNARPTSELLGSAGMFQTPEGAYIYRRTRHFSVLICTSEAEALDQWFENLQNYEATLVSTTKSPIAMSLTFFFHFIGRNGCGLIRCQFQGRTQRHRAM